jgi:hypothetical protein
MRMSKAGWKLTLASTLAGAMALGLASAARADVKAGVDAWGAGDYSKAVAEWRAPAAKGDPDALFNLAQAYRLGRGVNEDLRRAEALYQSAAALGHLKAADNYGLLLFQDGRREQAMPYVTAAAERGDPRAQYLLGIAHFNGDIVPKDWVRGYALLTLANGAGLPQAGPGLSQMDAFVPLPQRQQAQALAARMRASADAQRVSQMAAADLVAGPSTTVTDAAPARVALAEEALPPARVPATAAAAQVSPAIAAAEAAVAEAMRATGAESPATAGADYARPGTEATRDVGLASASTRPAVSMPSRPLPAPGTTVQGPWKVQLGAFSVPGNADRAWAQASGKAALAGKAKQTLTAGRLTRLLAAGWPSQGAAQAACNALKASGENCIVTR